MDIKRYRLKKAIRITDWHILPFWARGLALGTIFGAILIIFFSFSATRYYSKEVLYIPILILLICAVIGTIIGMSYNRKHK